MSASHIPHISDPSTEASARERKIRQVTLVGSFCNFLLLAFKAVAGFLGHSAAMVADAVHSLSDFLTDIIVLIFVRLSSKPQDCDHEYGHGKYETIATSLIAVSLLVVGIFLFAGSVKRIVLFYNGTECIDQPELIALIAATVSIVVKEALYWYTVIHGRRLKAQVVIANAWHHRSDAFSSIATFVGIGMAFVFGQSWVVLDPIAAAFVSVLIAKTGFSLLSESIDDLLDHALPKEVEEQILKIVGQLSEVQNPHNLRTRRIGARHAVDMHVRMDGRMTVDESHAITLDIEYRLRELLGHDTFVTIHVEPIK